MVAVMVPSQKSVAVGKGAVAEHSPVMLGRLATSGTGAVPSLTVTLEVQVAVWPELSVTVRVTVNGLPILLHEI